MASFHGNTIKYNCELAFQILKQQQIYTPKKY